jgi:hypothetical protein
VVALAAVGAVLGAGIAVASVVPASAHTGDLDVVAVCNTVTGEYDFTATLTISQTGLDGETRWRVGGSGFGGTPSSGAGMDRGPVVSDGAGMITLGTFSLPGDTTGYGPWVYAYTTWSDRYAKGSYGQLRVKLAGDCAEAVPEKPAPRPFHDETVTADCDFVTTYTRDGFYDLTLIDNVWVENAEPTVTAEASSQAPNEAPDVSCLPVKPDLRPWEDSTSDFGCEWVSEWEELGFFDWTLVEGVWVEDAYPTITSQVSTYRPPTEDEFAARCVVPAAEPVLADTGAADGIFWLLGACTVALGVLLVAIRSVARRDLPRYKRGA